MQAIRFGWTLQSNNNFLNRVIDAIPDQEGIPDNYSVADGHDFFIQFEGTDMLTLRENAAYVLPAFPSMGVKGGVPVWQGKAKDFMQTIPFAQELVKQIKHHLEQKSTSNNDL